MQSDSATFGAGLGLILGTRIYYSFVGCEHEDDVVFEKRLDPVVREIGDRGMARFAPTGVPEGVPTPTPAPARSAPTLLPAPGSRPDPAPNLDAAPARSAATLVPAPDLAPTSTVAAAPVRVPDQSVTSTTQMVPLEHLYALLEREWAQQQQMKADITAAHEQAKAATEKVREELMQKELITTEQLTALQSRLEILHTEQLLTDEELFALEVRAGTSAALMSRAYSTVFSLESAIQFPIENLVCQCASSMTCVDVQDLVADSIELKASVGKPTSEIVEIARTATSDAVPKVCRIITLSENIGPHRSFARQLRRKFVST